MRRWISALAVVFLALAVAQTPSTAPLELQAASERSGTVGTLVPGGRARGRLAGESGAVAYHTYVVEVPTGLARLVLELDADIDLDLAVKYGADIQSYAPRDQGGDWDHLDVGEQNPTVIAVEAPAAGRWYVDVIHALGTSNSGAYTLVVHVGVGGAGPAPAPGPLAEVPNPCLLLPLVPAAATLGPPPGVALGTRLVYYTAAASIPGERTQLVQDEQGNWVDRATGQRWSEQDVPGPAGEGFVAAQVAYLDGQRVVLSERHYLRDGASGQAMLHATAGMVSHAGCAGDYWVHPQALAALPEMDQAGTRVMRMPYRLGEQTFDAIRIHAVSASGFNAYVYDLTSGVRLYSGSRTTGADVLAPQPDGAAPGRGSTQLTNGWLVEARQVDVPWQNAPAPAWVAQFQQLDYQGTYTVMMPGSPAFPLPVQERLSAIARGPGWVQVHGDRMMYSLQNAPAGHEQVVMTHGPASVGGLWIAPEALARLTQGQVVDRCAVVGTTVSVTAVTGGTVTLSEVGPLHRQDLVYDAHTGILVHSTLVQNVGGTPHVSDLQLVGGPR